MSKFALAPEISLIFRGSPLQLGVSPPNLNKPVIDVRVWRGLVFLCPTIPMLPRRSPPNQRSDSWEAWPGCVTRSRSPRPVKYHRFRSTRWLSRGKPRVIVGQKRGWKIGSYVLKVADDLMPDIFRSRYVTVKWYRSSWRVSNVVDFSFLRHCFKEINLVEWLEYVIALNYGRLAFIFIKVVNFEYIYIYISLKIELNDQLIFIIKFFTLILRYI